MSPVMGFAFGALERATKALEERAYGPPSEDWALTEREFDSLQALCSEGESPSEAFGKIHAYLSGSEVPASLPDDSESGLEFRRLAQECYLSGRIARAEDLLARCPGFAPYGLLAAIAFRCRGDEMLSAEHMIECARRIDLVSSPTAGDVFRALRFRANMYPLWVAQSCVAAVRHGFERTNRVMFSAPRENALKSAELHALAVFENGRGRFRSANECFSAAIRARTRGKWESEPAPSALSLHYLGRAAVRINAHATERAILDLDIAESISANGSPMNRAITLCRAAGLWALLENRMRAKHCVREAYRTGVDRDVLDYLRANAVREIPKPYTFDPRPLGAGRFVHAF